MEWCGRSVPSQKGGIRERALHSLKEDMDPQGKVALFANLHEKLSVENVITEVVVHDVRFPTSLEAHGSDAIHTDPDYSAAYIVISVKGLHHKGHGLTFTLGRGTEVVIAAIRALSPLIDGKPLVEIFTSFGSFWHALTNESQLRWIGPQKGAVHLAVAAIMNALWDLWGRIESKPVWKLLCDMSPEEMVSLIDFHHITDVLTKQEALDILNRNLPTRSERVEYVNRNGYPAYITSIGWLGYSEEKISSRCKSALQEGFTRFKMKVGQDIADDIRRCRVIRNEIGWEHPLMMDANQIWDVDEAIAHTCQLAEFKPLWIEEPTSPDDILGHARIAEALRKLGIGVATGEHCHSKVMFKQFLEAKAMDFCQIDSCRLGGVNEIISVLLMAAKFNVPVCPHAGGVGLCELVQHLSIFDFICVSGIMEGRMIEYADHLHEHFVTPVVVRNGRYIPPEAPGYSSEMKVASLCEYKFPDGPVWKQLGTAN